MKILLSTTGVAQEVVFYDLGGLKITHPTTDLDLMDTYPLWELRFSTDLSQALQDGKITLKLEDGTEVDSVDNDLREPTHGMVEEGPQGPQGVSGAEGSQGPQGPAGQPGGTRYSWASDGSSSTTKETYKTKLSGTFSVPDAADIVILWSAEVDGGWHWSSGMWLRVELDGDCVAEGYTTDTGWGPRSGVALAQVGAGSHTVTLKYKSDNGDSVKIRRARLVVFC